MILIRLVYDACIWVFSVTIYNEYDFLRPSDLKSVFHSWLSMLLFLSCSFLSLSARDVQNTFNEFSVVKLRINGDYVCYVLQCFWTYWVPWWLCSFTYWLKCHGCRGVAPVGDVGVLTPTLFAMRGFNTHTFSAVFPQFRTNALQQ